MCCATKKRTNEKSAKMQRKLLAPVVGVLVVNPSFCGPLFSRSRPLSAAAGHLRVNIMMISKWHSAIHYKRLVNTRNYNSLYDSGNDNGKWKKWRSKWLMISLGAAGACALVAWIGVLRWWNTQVVSHDSSAMLQYIAHARDDLLVQARETGLETLMHPEHSKTMSQVLGYHNDDHDDDDVAQEIKVLDLSNDWTPFDQGSGKPFGPAKVTLDYFALANIRRVVSDSRSDEEYTDSTGKKRKYVREVVEIVGRERSNKLRRTAIDFYFPIVCLRNDGNNTGNVLIHAMRVQMVHMSDMAARNNSPQHSVFFISQVSLCDPSIAFGKWMGKNFRITEPQNNGTTSPLSSRWISFARWRPGQPQEVIVEKAFAPGGVYQENQGLSLFRRTIVRTL